MDLFR